LEKPLLALRASSLFCLLFSLAVCSIFLRVVAWGFNLSIAAAFFKGFFFCLE